MNLALQLFDDVASRMTGGQRAEFEHRQVEEAFPHPPRLSLFEMELEIHRLLSGRRGEVKPKPEPPTQEEQIDQWAEKHGLRVNRDMLTGNLHVQKERPRCPRCEAVMVPSKGQRFKPRPSPRPDREPCISEVCQIKIIDGLKCPGCGMFEPTTTPE